MLGPVTVAGPRRLLTGLPLTTGRYERRGSYIARADKKRGRPEGRPLATSAGRRSAYFFFCLHFWVEDAVNDSPL